MFGFPTRFGTVPSQFKSFLDSTGQLWMSGGLIGRPYGCFFSTASNHGGQETTVFSIMPVFTHHGMVFIPLGYGSPLLQEKDEIIGGSAWGAGTIAGGDGSRKVHAKEHELAKFQGHAFSAVCNKLKK